jgi:outer membrane lipoprotein SlyB
VSFTAFRRYVLISSVVGLLLGGLIGTFIGRQLDAQWGDLAGAVTGTWLGGPITSLIVFQILIGRLDVEFVLIKARIANFLITAMSAIMLLSIFVVTVRIASGSILLAPLLIVANFGLTYFNIILSLQIAKK